MVTDVSPQLAAGKQALSVKEKRLAICFLCLGDESLPLEKRISTFARPGDVTKHFKRKPKFLAI
jgi:hypothetical protein